MSEIIRLENARIRFCNLFEPRTPVIGGQPSGKPRYDATLMIEKGSESDKKMRHAIASLCQDVFKAQWKDQLEELQEEKRVQYNDGDSSKYRLKHPEYKGHMIVRATRQESQGPLLITDRDPDKELTIDDGIPYPGCWVNAVVQPYYNTTGGPRINVGLLGLQFVREDDRFAAGYQVTSADFEDLSVSQDSGSALDGLDDDISF